MFKPADEAMPHTSYTPPEASHDDIETVVGPSVVVEGDFASEGNILVKGTVSGSVKTGRLLTVEEGAKILANVHAGEAVVSGEIKGNMRISQRLELTESAKILGDVSCKILVVAPGAQLQGKISMGGIAIEGGAKEKKTSRRTRMSGDVIDEEE